MSSKSQYERERATHSAVESEISFDDPTAILLSMQDIVGRKWHPVILYALFADGPMGFSTLKDHANGISSKMLSESLDSLEAHGLVTREVVSEQPFRVEYSLTEAGETLGSLIADLAQWGRTNAVVLSDPGDAATDSRELSPDGQRFQHTTEGNR